MVLEGDVLWEIEWGIISACGGRRFVFVRKLTHFGNH